MCSQEEWPSYCQEAHMAPKQYYLEDIKIQAKIAELDKVTRLFKALSETGELFPGIPTDFFGLDKDEGPTDDLQ
jgi:hypothetical protein